MNQTVGSEQWQRISPLAIIDLFIKFLFSTLKESWLSLAPVALIISQSSGDKFAYALMITGSLLGIILLSASLYYLNFFFNIDHHRGELVVKQGIFKKERLTLKFNRIQNIHINQPFYFKPFRLVSLSVDSAGSSGRELTLVGLNIRLATRLRSDIFNDRQVHHEEPMYVDEQPDIPPAPADVKETELKWLNIGPKALAQYGMSNLALWSYVGIVFSAGYGKFADTLETQFNAFSQWLEHYFAMSWAVGAIIFIAVFIVLIAATLLLAITGAIIKFHRFQLFNSPGKLKRSAGLFEQHQLALAKPKVQAIELKQNFVAKLLGFYTVNFLQTSASHDSSATKKTFSIPYVKQQHWQSIVKLAFDDFNGQFIQFTKPHPTYKRRLFLLNCLTVIIILTALMVTMFGQELLLLLLLNIPGYMLCSKHYSHLGLWQNQGYTVFRTGLIGHRITIFPNHKVQHLETDTTPFQQKIGVRSLNIQLASQRIRFPYGLNAWVKRYSNRLLYSVASSNKPWF